MTEEERKKLDDIHTALFRVPPGSGTDEKPLIVEIRTVVLAYRRASWVTRVIVWTLPAVAGLGVAFKTIKGWVVNAGSGP